MIRARILSLDWSYPPMCRVILTKKLGNVIYTQVFKMKPKDLPMRIFNHK